MPTLNEQLNIAKELLLQLKTIENIVLNSIEINPVSTVYDYFIQSKQEMIIAKQSSNQTEQFKQDGIQNSQAI